MIKYKIVEVNTNEHSIVVRYYTDIITEEMLAIDILDGVIRRCRTDYSIDLPVPTPTGTALIDLINSKAPTAWLNTQEAVLNQDIDTSLSEVTSLMGIETEVVEPTVVEVTKTTFIYKQVLI